MSAGEFSSESFDFSNKDTIAGTYLNEAGEAEKLTVTAGGELKDIKIVLKKLSTQNNSNNNNTNSNTSNTQNNNRNEKGEISGTITYENTVDENDVLR